MVFDVEKDVRAAVLEEAARAVEGAPENWSRKDHAECIRGLAGREPPGGWNDYTKCLKPPAAGQ